MAKKKDIPLPDPDAPAEELETIPGEAENNGNDASEEIATAPAGNPEDESTAWRDIPGLPEGVEAFTRNRLWEGREYEIKVYEKRPIPNAPGKVERRYCESLFNGEVDEFWLQSRGYFGEFVAIRHWKDKKKDYKMQTGYFKIAPLKNKSLLLSVTPEPADRPGGGTPAPAQVSDEDAEERLLRKMKIYKDLFAPPAISAVSAGAPLPAGFGMEALEKSFERRFKMLDDREAALTMRELKAPAKAKEDNTPPWLQKLTDEFLPVAKKWLGRLTRDDDVGKAYREDLIKDPTFIEIWTDNAKKVKAVETLIEALGPGGQTMAQLIEAEMVEAMKAGAAA